MFHFNMHDGHLDNDRVEAALEAAGITKVVHVNYTEPNNGRKRGWFEGPNRGAPFNGELQAAVSAAIEEAGGLATLTADEGEEE